MAKITLLRGLPVIVQHTFELEDIEEGSTWVPVDGSIRKVKVLGIDLESREVFYKDELSSRKFFRDAASFQERYNLVVLDRTKYAKLVA